MPLFDFGCPDCGHTEERLITTDTEDIGCPYCQAKMARLFPKTAGFRINGYSEANGYSRKEADE